MTGSPGQPCPGPPGFNIFFRVVPDAGRVGTLVWPSCAGLRAAAHAVAGSQRPLWVLDLVTFQGPP